MKILIIANHANPDIALLTEESCIALLPIAGKSVLEHTLESVAKIKSDCVDKINITLVASRGLDLIREFTGSGEKWGMKIHVVSSRPNAGVQTLQAANELLKDNDLLVIECDRIRADGLDVYLSELQQSALPRVGHNNSDIEMHSGGLSSGLRLIRQNTTNQSQQVVNMQNAVVYPVTSPLEFHCVNLLAGAQDIPTLTTRGRERALGLTTGFLTRVHPRSIKFGKALIGNHCKVHSSCSLSGKVVINNGVVIDRNTSITDSVILDRTFVGENLEIKNAILTGNLLIRVDTGAVIEITDRFLTAKLGESLYDTHFAAAIHQLMGILLLITTLPLWPVALLAAFVKSPHRMWRKRHFVGNKSRDKGNHGVVFRTFEFEVTLPVLRHLPLTLAMARGHIRLVGVSLCTPEELGDRTDSWQIVRDSAPCGALGPSQLHLASDASSDEKIMSDAIFAQQSSAATSIQIVCQSIAAVAGYRRQNQQELVAQI